MIRFVLVIFSILLIVGCSSKEEKTLMKEYKTHKNYYKTLQKTEKVLLREDNLTKAVFTATYQYTPTIHSKSNDTNETFIIGLYLEDAELDSLSDIFDVYSKEDDNKTNVNNRDTNQTTKSKKLNTDVNSTLKNHYTLTLNGKKPLSITKLIPGDDKLKGLSFMTEWSTYALVKFKHIKGKHLKLKFESTRYGKGILNFSKVAKYVFTKKAI